MRQVRCDSGLRGWRGRLREVYSSLAEFRAYSRTYGLARRLKFRSDVAAWKSNPIIQGSVNPSDFRVAG